MAAWGKMNGEPNQNLLDKNLKMNQVCSSKQDDNPSHTAKKTLNWFQRQKVKPSDSPDSYQILNLWKELKMRKELQNIFDLETVSVE